MSVQSVGSSDISGMSLQSSIEHLYVGTANDVIGGALTNLQQALLTSSSILQTLTALQNAKNKVQIIERSVPAASKMPSTESAYIKFASNTFGKPIVPTLGSGFSASNINTLTGQLAAQLQALSGIVGVSGTLQAGGLYQTALNVYQDLSKNGPSAWVLDNYAKLTAGGTANTAGNFQNDLSLAVTAAQTLSSTQNEQVSNYLYIFQEYYQSAGSMLSQITQIMQHMAQNAGRTS